MTGGITREQVRLRRVRLGDLDPSGRGQLVARTAIPRDEVRRTVRTVLDDVRSRGDAAVAEANDRYGGGLGGEDGGDRRRLRLPPDEIRRAEQTLAPALRDALLTMITAIERFHGEQLGERERWVATAPGVRVGRLWRPIDRVAAYVPGGEAAYPSSLLMCVVPARLAGVPEVVVATPAGRDGRVSPVLLGAAGLLGITELYVMGGAQAIGALAYGTDSVPRVDKIVGPGNAWVTAAKIEVFGEVGIDLPAGPSEVMVLADDTADPAHVAADLLSQAEHGADSAAVLVTPSPALADAVEVEIDRQLRTLLREPVLRRSLASAGLIVEARDLDDAVAFVNEYAPEHLSAVTARGDAVVPAIRHAGSLFVGAYAPESAGDYATGSNHVLPTGGLARSCGALSVESFGKWLQVQTVTRDGLAALREPVGVVAEAEGLTAHRRAVEIRFETHSEASDGR